MILLSFYGKLANKHTFICPSLLRVEGIFGETMKYIWMYLLIFSSFSMNRNNPDQQSQDNISMCQFAKEPDSDDYSEDFEFDELQLDLEQGIIKFFQSFALGKEDDEIDL